ncbi:MAG: hypothetical protein RL318_1193 [Fibrobacterota bacterium]|jgi:class 3 adenylate cyclase
MDWQGRCGTGASTHRLERLIRDRLAPGADKEAIDRHIWDLFGETWAVMFTDLSGFSRNVAEFGIIHFLQTIQESQRLLVPVIEAHDGILLKTEGDSFMVIFRKPARALAAAREMMAVLEVYNADRPREETVLLCMGLGFGEMLRIGDADVFGAEVNAASKLGEDVAQAREILVTDAFLEALDERPPATQLEKAPPGAKRAWRLTA